VSFCLKQAKLSANVAIQIIVFLLNYWQAKTFFFFSRKHES